jgi:hypothetical protein
VSTGCRGRGCRKSDAFEQHLNEIGPIAGDCHWTPDEINDEMRLKHSCAMLLLLARQRPAWHSQHDGEPGLNWTGLDRGVGPCFILELGKDRGRGVGALPGAEAVWAG